MIMIRYIVSFLEKIFKGNKMTSNPGKSKFTINKTKVPNLEPSQLVNESESLPPIASDLKTNVQNEPTAEWFTAVGISHDKENNTYFVDVLDIDKNSNTYKKVDRIESGNIRAYANERLKIEIIKKIINKEVI